VGTDGEFDPTGKWEQGLDAATLGNAAGKLPSSPERWRCDVAMNGAGSGVMVWMVLEGSFATAQTDIVARRFTLADVEGVATLTFDDASEWLVNEVTTKDQFQCRVAIDDDGRFMVVWQDDDKNLYGRPFEADGTGLAQFQINPTIVGLETYYAPQLAVDKDAEGNMDFVISYVYNPDVVLDGQDNHVLAVLGSALSAATQVAGDLDHDGDVDIFDWAIFQPNYGKLSGAVYDEGDLDEDGDVDIFDWAIFQPMYGFGTGGEPVPEPVTLILLAAGSATMILRRRRS
jgi:hypothetical protein